MQTSDHLPIGAAAAVFAAAFGAKPAGFARGPGRVNLIGEHTDYNAGFVLPFAIDRQVLVAFAPRRDRRIRLVTDFAAGMVEASLDHLGATSGWSGYPLGVVWALGEFGLDLADLNGFDLAVTSSVPVGSGLSSSAALETATLMAVSSFWGIDLDRLTLAKVGQLAENAVVGAPTGVMDQAASLLGEPDAALLLDCRNLDHRVVQLGLSQAGLAVLVINTLVSHAHATGGYGQRRAECEQAANALGLTSLRELALDDLCEAETRLSEVAFRRVRHVVTENQRVLEVVEALDTQGIAGVGELLRASHRSMRDDFEISTPELDLAVAVASDSGAIGARMTGGGFGGSAIALIKADQAEVVGAAVVEAFVQAQHRRPELFVVRPVAGASLID